MFKNIILNVDSYKASHYLQYPPGTEHVSSYIESRGGAFAHTMFFGLQIFLKEVLSRPFTADDIDEAEAFFAGHGEPFNVAGWRGVLEKHNGYLPLKIEAVPEGMIVPTGNVLVQAINTDRDFPWLTSYIETALLRAVWYPTTVATLSWMAKQIIMDGLRNTCDDPEDQINFKLHDFGARGVSSEESAAIGGCAHLVNFMGSDTISGVLAARRYYSEPMAAFSIPAAEHSTITAWESETAAYANMLKQFGGKGKMLAVVSDSYDITKAVTNIWGGELAAKVRTHGGILVIRPDSGVPEVIVPEVIRRLAEAFPNTTTNSKGYMVLPPYVRVIQGDGINLDSIARIIAAMKARKQSVENISFGMGGGLLQQVNRDTQRFAMKASAIKVNGEWRDIQKNPATDPGKKSKAGRLALRGNLVEGYRTERFVNNFSAPNVLVPVFETGRLLRGYTLAEVRARAFQDTAALRHRSEMAAE